MSSKILVGFLAGAAVGALAGILFAPDKGSNTRRKIAGVKQTYAGAKEEAEDFANKAKAKLDGVKHEVKNAMS
jgi:gas vesicle protein